MRNLDIRIKELHTALKPEVETFMLMSKMLNLEDEYPMIELKLNEIEPMFEELKGLCELANYNTHFADGMLEHAKNIREAISNLYQIDEELGL